MLSKDVSPSTVSIAAYMSIVVLALLFFYMVYKKLSGCTCATMWIEPLPPGGLEPLPPVPPGKEAQTIGEHTRPLREC